MDKPSKTVQNLVDVAADIRTHSPSKLSFQHSLLCQVGLPRSKTDQLMYERRNGNALLRISAEPEPFGPGKIPYGIRPRLTLIHLVSEAVRTRSREIEVGGSINEFLKTIGMDTSGRGYAAFRTQAAALFSCRMTLGWLGGEVTKLDVASSYDAWLSNDGQQLAMWPGSVTLTHDFFETSLEHAVPLDARAINALGASSLGVDLYSWLAHRLHRIQRTSPVRLSWTNLADQFGGTPESIRPELTKTLKKVLAVYPDARVETIKGGWLLKHSKPPVPTIQTYVSQSKLSL